jgi:hypothetical protein
VTKVSASALTINTALSDINRLLAAQTLPGRHFEVKRASDVTVQDRNTARTLLRQQGMKTSEIDKWVEDQPSPDRNNIICVCLLALVSEQGVLTVAGVTILAFSTATASAATRNYQQPLEMVILAVQLAHQRRGIARLLMCVAADVGQQLGRQIFVVDSTLKTEHVWRRKHFLGQGKHFVPLSAAVQKGMGGGGMGLTSTGERIKLELLVGEMFKGVRYLMHEYTGTHSQRSTFSSHAIGKLKVRSVSVGSPISPIAERKPAKRKREEGAEEEEAAAEAEAAEEEAAAAAAAEGRVVHYSPRAPCTPGSLHIAPSHICDGDGLFASVDIGQGQLVVAMVNPIHVAEAEGARHLRRYRSLPADAVIYDERGSSGKCWAWYDASWTGSSGTRPLWHLLNHKRPANTRTKTRLEGHQQSSPLFDRQSQGAAPLVEQLQQQPQPAFEWVARKKISAGEEITFDYGNPDKEWSSGSSLSPAHTRNSSRAPSAVSSEKASYFQEFVQRMRADVEGVLSNPNTGVEIVSPASLAADASTEPVASGSGGGSGGGAGGDRDASGGGGSDSGNTDTKTLTKKHAIDIEQLRSFALLSHSEVQTMLQTATLAQRDILKIVRAQLPAKAEQLMRSEDKKEGKMGDGAEGCSTDGGADKMTGVESTTVSEGNFQQILHIFDPKGHAMICLGALPAGTNYPQDHCGWSGCKNPSERPFLKVGCTKCLNKNTNPQGYCCEEHWANDHGAMGSTVEAATASGVPETATASGHSPRQDISVPVTVSEAVGSDTIDESGESYGGTAVETWCEQLR